MSVLVRDDFYLFHTVYVCNKIPRAAVVIASNISKTTITQPSIFPSLLIVFHCFTMSAIVAITMIPAVAATTSIKKPICCLTIFPLFKKFLLWMDDVCTLFLCRPEK